MVTGTWGWMPRMCRVDLQVLLEWYIAGLLVRHMKGTWKENPREEEDRVPGSLDPGKSEVRGMPYPDGSPEICSQPEGWR